MVYKHSQGTYKALTRHVRKNLYCELKVIYTTYIKFLYKLLQAQQVSLSPKLIYKHNPNRSEACSTVLALQLPLLHHVWCRRHRRCATCSVTGTVIMPRMVSRALSSHCAWCCRHFCHTMWVLPLASSCHVWSYESYYPATFGVAVAAIMPCMVSGALSSLRVGVVAAVIALCRVS